jgi:hypothetical protein
MINLAEKLELISTILPPNPGQPKRNLLTLEPGNVIEIGKAQYLVEEAYVCTETNKEFKPKKYTWREYKLRDLKHFEIYFLEVEDDDKIELYITSERVSDRVVYPDDFKTAIVGDTMFHREEVTYGIFSGPKGEETFICHDYESDDGQMLSIEQWNGDDVNTQAYFYKEVKLGTVEIL